MRGFRELRKSEKNLNFIIDTLVKNGYPTKFIFRTISHRIKSLIHDSISSSPRSSSPPSPLRSFFVIPYINSISNKFKNVAVNINKSLAFVVSNKLNRFIKAHKDPLPKLNHSNVVYEINCKDCTASYVGQTSR